MGGEFTNQTGTLGVDNHSHRPLAVTGTPAQKQMEHEPGRESACLWQPDGRGRQAEVHASTKELGKNRALLEVCVLLFVGLSGCPKKGAFGSLPEFMDFSRD